MDKKPKVVRLNKRQIDYYFHRICRLIKSQRLNIDLKRMKKKKIEYDGLTDYDNNIWLDPCCRLLPTLIHEALHVLYPPPKRRDLITNHDWINGIEDRLTRRLSERQLKNLLLLVAENIKNSRQAKKVSLSNIAEDDHKP